MDCIYHFNTTEIINKCGLQKDGRVQKVVDSQIVKYLRETMPVGRGIMRANTRTIEPGITKVNVPYAHYMNEGILYVMPDNGKGAFYSKEYGYWSKPVVKKIPSGKSLNYRGGADRGAHFVERTINGHFNDILKSAKKEVGKK